MKHILTPFIASMALALPSFAAEALSLEQRIEALELPGIEINAKERYIDVDSSVCLDVGALELVACTKDSKEHESIVMIEAKAVHIHLALLLLGAKNGSPATQRMIGEGEEKRIQFIMAHGHPVEVSLVIPDEDGKQVVRPIADFIQHVQEEDVFTQNQVKSGEEEKFPTSTYLFLGSHLMGNGDGPRRYLADESGNVISISNFGDEVLGLPMEFSAENGSLMWEVNPDLIPATGTKVKLRLKPVFKEVAADAKPADAKPAETKPSEESKPEAKK